MIRVYDADEGVRYLLLAEVRSGGEGQVWRARELTPARADPHGGGTDHEVAVKVLHPKRWLGQPVDSDTILRQWRAVVDVMRPFTHPGFTVANSVFSIAADPDDPDATARTAGLVGLPAFVIEWNDGTPYDEWCAGVEDPLVRLDALRDAADGLDAFHRETHHVHRDIKPDNLIVVGDRTRIIDYGLVRSVHQHRQGSAALGTVGYLAPEIALEADYSFATDLFAFAGVCYYAVTRAHPPIGMHNRTEIMRRNLAARPECANVASLLLATLHLDPAKRKTWPGAAGLLGALLRAAPTVAVRPTPPTARAGATAPGARTVEVPGTARMPTAILEPPSPDPSARQVLSRAVALFFVVLMTIVIVLLIAKGGR